MVFFSVHLHHSVVLFDHRHERDFSRFNQQILNMD